MEGKRWNEEAREPEKAYEARRGREKDEGGGREGSEGRRKRENESFPSFPNNRLPRPRKSPFFYDLFFAKITVFEKR